MVKAEPIAPAGLQLRLQWQNLHPGITPPRLALAGIQLNGAADAVDARGNFYTFAGFARFDDAPVNDERGDRRQAAVRMSFDAGQQGGTLAEGRRREPEGRRDNQYPAPVTGVTAQNGSSRSSRSASIWARKASLTRSSEASSSASNRSTSTGVVLEARTNPQP